MAKRAMGEAAMDPKKAMETMQAKKARMELDAQAESIDITVRLLSGGTLGKVQAESTWSAGIVKEHLQQFLDPGCYISQLVFDDHSTFEDTQTLQDRDISKETSLTAGIGKGLVIRSLSHLVTIDATRDDVVDMVKLQCLEKLGLSEKSPLALSARTYGNGRLCRLEDGRTLEDYGMPRMLYASFQVRNVMGRSVHVVQDVPDTPFLVGCDSLDKYLQWLNSCRREPFQPFLLIPREANDGPRRYDHVTHWERTSCDPPHDIHGKLSNLLPSWGSYIETTNGKAGSSNRKWAALITDCANRDDPLVRLAAGGRP